MKYRVQNSINQVRQMAKSPINPGDRKDLESLRDNDSLLKGIRNVQEANVFIAELSAAIKMASKMD